MRTYGAQRFRSHDIKLAFNFHLLFFQENYFYRWIPRCFFFFFFSFFTMIAPSGAIDTASSCTVRIVSFSIGGGSGTRARPGSGGVSTTCSGDGRRGCCDCKCGCENCRCGRGWWVSSWRRCRRRQLPLDSVLNTARKSQTNKIASRSKTNPFQSQWCIIIICKLINFFLNYNYRELYYRFFCLDRLLLIRDKKWLLATILLIFTTAIIEILFIIFFFLIIIMYMEKIFTANHTRVVK